MSFIEKIFGCTTVKYACFLPVKFSISGFFGYFFFETLRTVLRGNEARNNPEITFFYHKIQNTQMAQRFHKELSCVSRSSFIVHRSSFIVHR
jgi:hypothetical protein